MISPIVLSQLAETVATCAISVRSLDLLGDFLQLLDDGFDGLSDAALQRGRVRAGGDVAQTFAVNGFGENGRRGRAVARDVRGLGSDFANELGAHIFIRIFELDFFRDRHTVLGDRRAAEFLVENDVATARSERGLDGLREFLDTAQQRVPRVFIEL